MQNHAINDSLWSKRIDAYSIRWEMKAPLKKNLEKLNMHFVSIDQRTESDVKCEL